jgi:hypothetical protein
MTQSAQPGAGARQQRPGEAPEGWVLVQERVIVLTANEPQNHFLRAQQHLSQNDVKAAAGEVRAGASYLEMQASRGKAEADPHLSQAADRLWQLAGQIDKQGGDAKEHEQQLKQAFADANVALARHLQAMAQWGVKNQRAVMAGHDLEAAAESLAAAYAWSGKQPAQDVTSAVQQAQQVALRLMMPDGGATGAGATGDADGRAQTASARIDQRGGTIPDNATNAIDQLGSAIQQARQSMQGGGQQGRQGDNKAQRQQG